ncbi:MAG: ROK family transcriptional regulator [Anaerolineae bacterium]|nr:MAG: ROK family transcriptional regulator [Anaerolineae bacterium]
MTYFGTNNIGVKHQNLSAILLKLLQTEDTSRSQLAHQLGIASSTVTNLVGELIAAGIVSEFGAMQADSQANIGRPKTALRLNHDALYAVGVHFDVGLVHIALVDLSGKVIKTHTIGHSLEAAWSDVLDKTCQHVTLLLDNTRIDPAKILGVGVAASGLVDPNTGINVFAPNLKWHNVPIQDYVGRRLGFPVIVENNVRAMALGEFLFGIARGVHSTAFVYARYGVGAGFVVNGQLFRGSGAGAGEIGHAKFLLQQNESNRNVVGLEDLISEPAILRDVYALAGQLPSDLQHLAQNDQLTLPDVFRAARQGEQKILYFLQERAFYAGLALANLVNIFNPDLIVLGGLLDHYADILLLQIRRTATEHAFAALAETIRIEQTSLGEQAGMIGAAALVLSEMFYRPGIHSQRIWKEEQIRNNL